MNCNVVGEYLPGDTQGIPSALSVHIGFHFKGQREDDIGGAGVPKTS